MDSTFWLVLALLTSASRANGRRLSRLERRVDLILAHLGIDPNHGVNSEIVDLLKDRKKIQAIRVYRERTGAGLKEAKEYVESL